MRNEDIADRLSRLANLLAIEGAHAFRVRAYRDAARSIEALTRGVADLIGAGADLTQLPAIDQDLATKIVQLVHTGSFPLLEEVTSRTPASLSDLMRVTGLGPKRIKVLHDELGVTTFDDLERIIRQGELRRIRGFGAKSEDTVKARLDRWRRTNGGVGERRHASQVFAAAVSGAPEA